MNKFSLKASRVHPGSWWLLGLCSALVAGLSRDPISLITQIGLIVAIILLAREVSPWSQSLRFYLGLAAFVVLIRVLFRIAFNIPDGSIDIALSLPQMEIDLGFGSPVTLLGEVSTTSLLAAATDGLRLAAIILSVGLANSLANPRKLLKATPAALYEVATSVSVAINLAPQLIDSLQRVRRARMLRGRSRGLGTLAGTIVPVLEDTIDKSLSLAASMDARGFGRRGTLSGHQVIAVRLTSLASVAFTTIGVFLLLVATDLQSVAISLIALGFICMIATVRLTSKHSVRTRFHKTPWLLQDFVVLAIGVLGAAAQIFGWQN